jgi:hypothetical protein
MPFRVNINPHNDLFNLAFHHIETMRGKQARGEAEGLALDSLSSLIATAFAVEAVINFVGARNVAGWVERRSPTAKLAQLCDVLDIQREEYGELFRTLDELRGLRNSLAHAQPQELVIVDGGREALDGAMRGPWGPVGTPAYAENAFATAQEFRRILFARAGITPGSALTSAFGGG